MTSRRLRELSHATLFLVASLGALTSGVLTTGALAQGIFSPPAPPQQIPQGQSSNPVCVRLEGQLAAIDRGGNDPARTEQIKRYEDAANKQEGELDPAASVVISIAATLAAFSSAVRTTLAGSITPASTRSSKVSVRALKPKLPLPSATLL